MKKYLKFVALICCLVMIMATACACGDKEESAGTDGSGDVITLSVAHVDAETRCTHQGWLKFKEELENVSGGQMTIEIFPNSSLGTEKEMLEQMQQGQIDMMSAINGPTTNYVPFCSVFDLPYLFESDDHVKAVMANEDVFAKCQEEFEACGYHLLDMWENGFRSIATNDKPVLTPADSKGMKLRTLESDVMVKSLEAIGASCVPMSANEVYTACQNGTLDGYDQVLNSIVAYKTYEVTENLALTEMFYPMTWAVMNKDKWESLTEEQQGWIVAAMEVATPYQNEVNKQQTDEAIGVMEEAGMKIYDDVDKTPFIDATKPIYDEMADTYDKDFVDLIKSLK